MKSGILGGTFDPIHLGHLRTAVEIGEELDLQKVYLIPSASPPHKKGDPVIPFDDRLAMAKLAVGDFPLLEVLDLEGRRPGPSYSVETLAALRESHGAYHEFYFVVGMDAFLEIQTWKDYRRLFDYTHFVIIQRAGHTRKDLEPFLSKLRLNYQRVNHMEEYLLDTGKRVLFQSTTLMEISSTRIRRTVAAGKSIHFLVPDSVERYIVEKGLYREDGSH